MQVFEVHTQEKIIKITEKFIRKNITLSEEPMFCLCIGVMKTTLKDGGGKPQW